MSMLDRVKRMFASKGNIVSVPVILQMEATECGAASLAMILAHYGQWVPLEKLRQECGVNRDGSKANCVLRAARKRGCNARGFRCTADRLKKKEYPVILHWEFNHFLVLEGIKNNIAYLNDPAHGHRKVPWEDFRTSFTGVALEIRPGKEFKKEGSSYNIGRVITAKLLKDKWAMIFAALIGLFLIVPGLAAPVFSQIFLDEIMTLKHKDWMPKLALAMLVGILLFGVLTTMRSVLLTRWQKKLTIVDSSSFFWHTLRLPMEFFHQRYSGEIASRIAFNESVAEVLSNQAATAVLDFLVAVFYLILLLQYSIQLTLIGLMFIAMDVAVFFALRRRITDLNMRIQQDSGKEYGTIVNGLTMIESMKANGTENDFFAKWSGFHTKVMTGAQEVELWSIAATIIPMLLMGINAALILTFGSLSVMEGIMTIGVFMAFQGLMNSFQTPVNKLVGLGGTLQSTEMQMRRLDDVRKYPIDELNYPTREDSAEFYGTRLSGELELKDISFGYSPLEPPLIEHFNLHLEPGNWVALVGGSGSGKSTMAKVVTGLYEEWSGSVMFNGISRRNIPRVVIVNSLSSVDQDVFQISGTVQNNITLFETSIAHADVVRAAKDACIHDDILKLDGGYNALVAEGGVNFSGGQRQRMELARALARNPSILILDEATSALDPVTEKKVLDNIRHRGCTCLMIAHRLSTIRDCDEIVVMDDGKVVEHGTHKEMMKNDGPYRQLIEDQNRG